MALGLCVLMPMARILPCFLAFSHAATTSSVIAEALSRACMYQMSRWSVRSSLRLVSRWVMASEAVRAMLLLESITLSRLPWRQPPTMRSLFPPWYTRAESK